MRAIAVARKDLWELPTYFKMSILVVPLIMVSVVTMLIYGASTSEGIDDMPDLPDSLFPAGLSPGEKSIFYAVNFMAPPFFLMLATMVPITIAADAFAGERERKTLETLLALPLSSKDLFIGKALLPLSYGFGSAVAAFILISIATNLILDGAAIAMPGPNWLVLIFVSVPAFSLLAILVELMLSTRVDRTYYAMQIGSLIILPMLILVIGGVSGMFVMGQMLLLVLSLGIFLLDYILIQIGADSLARGL
jgi:ABC-type Na+ efflux pump permease subunit